MAKYFDEYKGVIFFVLVLLIVLVLYGNSIKQFNSSTNDINSINTIEYAE